MDADTARALMAVLGERRAEHTTAPPVEPRRADGSHVPPPPASPAPPVRQQQPPMPPQQAPMVPAGPRFAEPPAPPYYAEPPYYTEPPGTGAPMFPAAPLLPTSFPTR